MAGFAKSDPTSSAIVLVGKSPWKIGWMIVMGLNALLVVLAPVSFIRWEVGIWLTLLFALCAYPAIFLWLQVLLVSMSKQTPLILEPEGLRVNFTGDFIRYDQVAGVDFAYLNWAGTLAIKLVPGVKLKLGHAPYRLGWGHRGKLGFFAMYTIPVSELAGEVERRMKALSG